MEQQILTSVTHITSCVLLLLAALLWLQRGSNRSRIYLATAYFVCGIDLFLRLFTAYDETSVADALNPGYIYMSLIQVPLFISYIIEVVNPGWLNRKRIGLMCLPWLVWNIIMFVPVIHFRVLTSFADIFTHITEFNVWLRVLFMLIILSFCLMTYYIPYNWRRSSADLYLIRVYGVGIIILALFFVISSFSNSAIVGIFHLTYGAVFCFCIAYHELFIRLQVPKEGISTDDNEDFGIAQSETHCITACESDEGSQSMESGKVADKVVDEQWSEISRIIEVEQPWRNPDISIVALADLLKTNRTTLSRLLQEQGYSGGYKEFINRHRIADFIDLMDKHPRTNMQDAFFEVGYRSRATALRNFKEYMGIGPSEYFNNLNRKK